MELEQLEYFMVLSEELHFTRAAEKIGIAQPSLSQQIRLLEHHVGTPLFDRTGRGTTLTEAGEILLKHCFNVFHELSQAKAAISELQGLDRGTLKIGALLTATNYLMPTTIVKFHERYPNIEISVVGLRSETIYKKILQNELDVGIALLPVQHKHLESHPLYKDQLAFAVPKDHALANESSLPLSILQEVPSVLLPNTFFSRQVVNKKCALHGFTPEPVMEISTMESLLNIVRQGIGITVLSQIYLDFLKDENLRVIPIVDPELVTEIGVVYRKNKHLCATSRAFLEHLTEAVTVKL